MSRIILALIILLLGLALAVGGVWLITLGGTWGFAILAIPLLLSALLLLWRRRSALAMYALVIALTLVWALWEVRFDWWALAPREGLIVVLGLLLLLPPVARSLTSRSGHVGRYGVEGASLVGVLVVAAVIAGVALFSHPHEIDGSLTAKRMAAQPTAADSQYPGEWRAYGRTAAGQRYSPLTQINTRNVDHLEKVWEYHAGNIHPGLPGSAFESTPLIVGDTLYVCTPRSEVIAPIAKGQSYTENAPNSWSVASYDPELNLVYLPFGDSSPDQYGWGGLPTSSASPLPWWRWTPRRARCAGCSGPCTTICGITTFPPSPVWST